MTERALILAAIVSAIGTLWLIIEIRSPSGPRVNPRAPEPPRWDVMVVASAPDPAPLPGPQHIVHHHVLHGPTVMHPPGMESGSARIARRQSARAHLSGMGVDISDLPPLPEVIDGEVIES